MASPKKWKRSHVTAITSAIEHPPPASPERLSTCKSNDKLLLLPVTVTPGRSNPDTAIGKHLRDATKIVQQTLETKPIIHNTAWSAWRASNPTFPI